MYSDGRKPVLYESDIFKTEIPLSKNAAAEQKNQTELTERESKIYDLIQKEKAITVDKIAVTLGVNRRTILRSVQEMKNKIEVRYDRKSGEWVI